MSAETDREQAELKALRRALAASAPRYFVDLRLAVTGEYELRVAVYPRVRLSFRGWSEDEQNLLFGRNIRSAEARFSIRRFPIKPTTEQVIAASLEMLEGLSGDRP